ncbi:MAG TPA: MmgE/PrpD family protein [Dehalococcoidales bacterium]
MGVTEKIARLLTNTGYEDIPGEARDIARDAILDCVGVTIAGSGETAVGILAEQVKAIGAAPQAGVICGGFGTSADLAAWVNGAASHVLDYDDTIALASNYNMHPTVPVLPALLAAGESVNSSGRDIILAYVLGLEVEYRIGSAIGAYTSALGWHPTPVLGTIGAAAACAKIFNLTVEQIRMAIGIAGSMAGGLTRNFGTMTKSLHAGNAARNGIVAASLARRGFTADSGLLERDYGFCHLFSAGQVKEPTISRSGKNWEIVATGITFKPYPCCRGTHPSIDAVLYLRNKHHITADQVAGIKCKTKQQTHRILRYDRPGNGLEAKFSMQYCVSVALLRGKVTLADFSAESLNDPAVCDIIPKISYLHPEEWEKENSLTQEVVMTLKDGREYVHRVDTPRGEPKNPMTPDELKAKFTDCARRHFSPAWINQLLEMLTDLESLSNISNLMKLLTYGTAVPAGKTDIE